MSPILSRLSWAQGFGRRPYTVLPGSAIFMNIEDVFSTYNYRGEGQIGSWVQKAASASALPTASTDSPFTGTGEGYNSVEFDLNKSIEISQSSRFDFGNTESFTIEWWEKRFPLNSTTNIEKDPYMTVMDLGTSSSGIFIGLGGTNEGKYQVTMGPSGVHLLTESTGVAANSGWHHYALSVQFVNSSQTYRIFRDGVVQDTATGGGINWGSNNSNFTIGGQKQYPGNYNFQGRISNFRVTRGISRYNSNFSIPTKPFGDWADGTNTSTLFVCCKSKNVLGVDGDILVGVGTKSKKTRVKYFDEGGLIWIKSRSQTSSHCLVDTLRGRDKWLDVSSNNSQATDDYNVTAFTGDGYSLGNNSYVNAGSQDFTSWSFAKNSKFMDIIEYTGDGAASRYIDHALDGIPGFIIIKNLDQNGTGWVAIHRNAETGVATPGQGGCQLNSNHTTIWNLGDTPSDIYPSLGGPVNKTNQFHVTSNWNNYETSSGAGYLGTNNNGEKYIAYVFAHDESENGVIRCGYFNVDGNGKSPVNGANDSYNDLGWEPQWLMTKEVCEDTTNYPGTTGDWLIWDDKRGVGEYSRYLRAESTNKEAGTSDEMSFRARGFRCKGFANGRRFIYVAIRKGLMGDPEDTKRKAIDLFALGRGGTTCAGNNGGFGTQVADGGEVTEATGQQAYLTPGSYTWTCPANVTKVHAVCIGAGGGGTLGGNFEAGGGGGLGWKNDIPVTPGQSYNVVVGDHGNANDDGNDSYFVSASTVKGGGGKGNNQGGGDFVGDGGGNGGTYTVYGGGGGAGGYSADGNTESGGSGGKGAANGLTGGGAGGGGVGVMGEGASGTNCGGDCNNTNYGATMEGGGGGSGGADGTDGTVPTFSGGYSGGVTGGPGGDYGGGAGGNADSGSTKQSALGAPGAVRLIWGDGRAFPATNTTDQPANQGTSTAVKSYGFAPDMGFVLQSYDASGGARECFSRVSGTSSAGLTGDTIYSKKWDLDGGQPTTDSSIKWLLNGGNCGGNNLANNDVIWTWRRAKGFFDSCYFYSNGNANQPYAHNLGAVPEMIWYRRLDGSSEGMFVYHKDMPVTQYGVTAQTNINTGSNVWGDGTVPHTKTTFTMGDTAGNNFENVAFLFATNPGISKVGKYDTLANGDPQDIDCGFTTGARAVIIKQISSSAGNGTALGWYCFDNARGMSDSSSTSSSGSVNFNGGINSYLKFSNPGSALQFGSNGAYTIEFWIKTTASSGWIMYNASTDTGMRLCMGNNGGGGSHSGKIEVNEQVSNGDSMHASSSQINDGQWHHVAVARPTNGAYKIFIDGTHETTGDSSRDWGNTNDVYFGRREEGYNPINAEISNFRIQGDCKYTSSFTAPTTPLTTDGNTKLLFMQSPTVKTEAAVTPNTIVAGSGGEQASSSNPFASAASPYMRLDNTSLQQTPASTWIKKTDSGFRIESSNILNTANETYIYYAIA